MYILHTKNIEEKIEYLMFLKNARYEFCSNVYESILNVKIKKRVKENKNKFMFRKIDFKNNFILKTDFRNNELILICI